MLNPKRLAISLCTIALVTAVACTAGSPPTSRSGPAVPGAEFNKTWGGKFSDSKRV